MKSIILAAGVGRRLGADMPKCMIEVAGTSIIHRQLAAFRAVGVTEFVVVVGHEQDRLRDHLADQPGRFTFVVNERYAETNTIYSLYLARAHVDGAFFYSNGDVLFDRRLTERLQAADDPSVLAVLAGACGDEEVKVIVTDGKITRIGKTLEPASCLGEFVGVARFAAEIAPVFASALTLLVESRGTVDDYFELAVDQFCGNRLVTPIDVSDLPCMEIDFPEDLERARQHVAPRLID